MPSMLFLGRAQVRHPRESEMMKSRIASVTLYSRIEGDETINTYTGEYALRDGIHLITYTDYTGNGITKNGLQAGETALLLHRVGEFEGDMLFDPKMDTVVKYTAGGLVQAGFILHTDHYSVTAEPGQLKIHIQYVLYDGSGEDGIHGEQNITAQWEKKGI